MDARPCPLLAWLHRSVEETGRGDRSCHRAVRGAVKGNFPCNFCGDNDHSHFQVDEAVFGKICGYNNIAGFCELVSAEPVKCDAMRAPWPVLCGLPRLPGITWLELGIRGHL